MRASDTDRERIAQALQTAVSEGRLSVAEVDERLGKVYEAKTLGELDLVVVDLPNVSALPAVRPAAEPAAPSNLVGGEPGSKMSIAIMSGTTRKGHWVVPPEHTSFAFWGGVEIDLRNARFAEQHTVITAVAFMGGIEVTVPDDVIVEVTGIGIMGGFESADKKGASDAAPPGAPRLKVNGLALMGGVEVKRVPREPRKRLEK